MSVDTVCVNNTKHTAFYTVWTDVKRKLLSRGKQGIWNGSVGNKLMTFFLMNEGLLNLTFVFLQTKLPVLENLLSMSVRSLVIKLSSQAPFASKVSCCCCCCSRPRLVSQPASATAHCLSCWVRTQCWLTAPLLPRRRFSLCCICVMSDYLSI